MAGPDELVYYESSREAALALDPWFVPVDETIIGIVDDVHLLKEEYQEMILGKVCGAIHSTINHKFYDNRKILVVDKLDMEGQPTGEYLIAVDSVGAGSGETVLVIDEGNSARSIVKDDMAPLRSIIVGIVDQVNIT